MWESECGAKRRLDVSLSALSELKHVLNERIRKNSQKDKKLKKL